MRGLEYELLNFSKIIERKTVEGWLLRRKIVDFYCRTVESIKCNLF